VRGGDQGEDKGKMLWVDNEGEAEEEEEGAEESPAPTRRPFYWRGACMLGL
jgi:hypothetical protein